ncbi:MAG: tRNA pseudouridine(55) synthase TruB [Clostridiales Family XIII bacterium]|jgi:tRNA pseudouridine55 synthase|nr:tRNA pseudouridine(55) synthase TruB [Clostridiales Family XIII bacterium]
MDKRPEGMINFLKPAGMTSMDAVSFLRRLTGVKRIGHTGTLDPMAAGVLPLCLGGAARLAEYLAEDDKAYCCEMALGLKTDTMDVWGAVLERAPEGFERELDEEALRRAIMSFVGRMSQKPPAYSAIKVSGRKLYEYARAGEAAPVPEREVHIKEITVKRINIAERWALMDVRCSKGTYIRSLCNDIGEALGCGAAMSGLVRTVSGCFRIESAHTAEELAAACAEGGRGLGGMLLPSDYPLRGMRAVTLEKTAARRFVNGAPVASRGPADLVRVYLGQAAGGEPPVFLGIGRAAEGILRAEKVLCPAL